MRSGLFPSAHPNESADTLEDQSIGLKGMHIQARIVQKLDKLPDIINGVTKPRFEERIEL